MARSAPTAVTRTEQSSGTAAAPTASGLLSRLRYVGPGIVLAMASVGAGDMVTTLNSASQFGLGLAWVFLIGILLKYALSEAVGRLQLTGDRTLMSHMTDVGGRLFPAIFLIAVLLVGMFFGSGLTSITTLTLQAIFPGLPFWPTAIAVAASAAVLVGIGKYGIVEKAMMGFGFLMFFGMIAVAFISTGDADAGAAASQTIAPVIPGGSLITMLSLIGGVGGAAGILAYAYWVREKTWQGPTWKPVIRIDAIASYSIITVFALAMTVAGTALLYTDGISIEGSDAVLPVADALIPLGGAATRLIFLISFFAIVYTSILGGFSAMGYLISDCVRVLRGVDDSHADAAMSPTSPMFRVSLVYSFICTVTIMSQGSPVTLVLIYATVSAFILPFLSIALLVLLNRRSVPPELRNGPLANIALSACLALFGFLAVLQIIESLSGLAG